MPGSKQKTGLGRSLIRSRFIPVENAKGPGKNAARHTTELYDQQDDRNFNSIVHENDLEAFLSTAQLAGTDFTADRLAVKVLTARPESGVALNPFLLSPDKEALLLARHEEERTKLKVPRRPEWDTSTTPSELRERENKHFLDWRRGLAFLEEEQNLLMTPYEKNLEIWRQLWRVVERSDMVVQIVDARNPMLFRSDDLDAYIHDLDPRKVRLLLVNKSDLLTQRQREEWAAAFTKLGLQFAFFSAGIANEEQTQEKLKAEAEALAAEKAADQAEVDAYKAGYESDDSDEEEEEDKHVAESNADDAAAKEAMDTDDADAKQSTEEAEHTFPGMNTTQVLSALDLHHLIKDLCPPSLSSTPAEPTDDSTAGDAGAEAAAAAHDDRIPASTPAKPVRKRIVGFVGYPNVGKSSTLNALLGAKKVAVAATPGKTKHFQTIHLDDEMILCDCPGLVFPSFATTQGDLVCNGVLPIDQMREYTAPSELVAQRVPRAIIEATYGIHLGDTALSLSSAAGVTGKVDLHSTPTDVHVSGLLMLRRYAIARGYRRNTQGQPDESRAARYILKDFVSGKLLYAQAPPPFLLGENAAERVAAYHRETVSLMIERLREQKGLKVDGLAEQNTASVEAARQAQEADAVMGDGQTAAPAPSAAAPRRSDRRMDANFFGPATTGRRSRAGMLKAKAVTAHSTVALTPFQNNTHQINPQQPGIPQLGALENRKHHKKGKKNEKRRTRWTADDDE